MQIRPRKPKNARRVSDSTWVYLLAYFKLWDMGAKGMSLDRAKKRRKSDAHLDSAGCNTIMGHEAFFLCAQQSIRKPQPKKHMSGSLFHDRPFVPLFFSKTIFQKKGASGIRDAPSGLCWRVCQNTWFAWVHALAAVALRRWQTAMGQRGRRKRGKRTNPQRFLHALAIQREKNAIVTKRRKKRRTQHQRAKEEQTTIEPRQSVVCVRVCVFSHEQRQDQKDDNKRRKKRDGAGVRSSGGGSNRQARRRVDALYAGPVLPGRRHQHGL